MARVPSVALIVSARGGRPFWEAKWRHHGRQVKRRVGPAWLALAEGRWEPRRGRPRDGALSRDQAAVKAAQIAAEYVERAEAADELERDRRRRGPSFRELARAFLEDRRTVYGARRSTLRGYESILAEPGAAYARGRGERHGHVMRALGNRPAKRITAAEVDRLLTTIAATGVSAATVNRHRQLISAIFGWAVQSNNIDIDVNPVSRSVKRRESTVGALPFYSVEDVEQIARTLEASDHDQDAEAVRISAYSGLRLGELLALRWSDVDWHGHAINVRRAWSAGVEGPPKSGQARRVPLTDQAAAALDRVSRREHFTAPDELVICNEIGRRLDGSALRRRYKAARDQAGLAPLRWHDLRHTYGSLLVAGGVDLVSVQSALGHAKLETTGRYLHARPATELAQRFTAALAGGAVVTVEDKTPA